MEARILGAEKRAEKRNAALEVELTILKQNQGSQAFGVSSGGAPFGTGGGGGAGLPPNFFDDVRNMVVRLDQLEAKSDGNAITIGVRTFRSSRDCETFILQECPGGSLNTFCYDMVSLLNRVSRRGMKTSPTDEVAHEAAVRKGGFPNKASQMIHSSYQTAFPGPLNVTATAEQAAAHPIPAIKTFDAWDMLDGKTGLGPELTQQMALEYKKICAMIRVDCTAHVNAMSLYEQLVVRSQSQFTSLTQFINNNYGQSLTNSGDKEESHRFTMEVVGGVFQECYKVRCQAADRTSMTYSVGDAGRSLWAALQTTELLNEMIMR